MKIFLSHVQETKDLIRRIHARLPAHIEIWIDVDYLDLGIRIDERIRTAIMEEVDFVVVFLGTLSLTSRWVEQELNWALEREALLKRPFLLPVLLDDVWSAYESRPEIGERLYLSCLDHSPEALDRAGDELKEHLFATVSRLFTATRTPPRRVFLDAMVDDLMQFKEIAFSLHGSLSESVGVIGRNQLAFDRVVKAMERYNSFTTAFIARLPDYCATVKAYWGHYFARKCTQLVDYVENEVYRRQVFSLKEVQGALNLFTVSPQPSDADIEAFDQRKAVLLHAVQESLVEMSQRVSEFAADLEQDMA